MYVSLKGYLENVKVKKLMLPCCIIHMKNNYNGYNLCHNMYLEWILIELVACIKLVHQTSWTCPDECIVRGASIG